MFQLETIVLIGSMIGLAPSVSVAQVGPIYMKAPLTMPDPNGVITAQRQSAHRLFRALTGISLAIDDSRLKDMETLLKSGKTIEAERIATADPLFYNNRVRDLARKMSTRAESVRAPLSDFVATFVGVVRDSDTTPATQLLTGNFTYRADNTIIQNGGGTPVRMDEVDDILSSNNHYADIQANNYSLKGVLKRVENQRYVSNNAAADIPMDQVAGLITSRAFLSAHADMGTNRRLVEFSFRQFMCAPITDWADGSSPDDRVGRDVDRQPGGSPNKFLTTCKNCHANMDGLRGAFALVDYNAGNGRVSFMNTVPTNTNVNTNYKLNRNGDVYPQGFITRDNSFVNYANVGKNADAFGWRSTTSGTGIAKFGEMLAKSRGFSRCMVKRVFTDVCKRAPASSEDAVVRSLADQFEASNYHLRGLFEIVAGRPECGIN